MTRPKDLSVRMPTGEKMSVQNAEERLYVERKVKEYAKYKITDEADKGLLKQLIVSELLHYRYSEELNKPENASLKPSEAKSYNEIIQKHVDKTKDLMAVLGISAKKDEKDANYWPKKVQELILRAKQFGEQKDAEMEFALDFMAELQEKIRMRKSCDAEEIVELKITDDDIFNFIEERLHKFGKLCDRFKDKQTKWNLEDAAKAAYRRGEMVMEGTD